MNPWSLLSFVLGAIYLTGFVTLVYCAKWAPEGYEDEDGFHFGHKPAAPTDGREPRERHMSEGLEQATWGTAAPF